MAAKKEWVDVAPFLERVCDGMYPGEMLHGEHFSLHNAMLAIEIGDEKMDLGCRGRGEADPRSVEQLIEDGHAPVVFENPATLIALLDRLLEMEAMWHNGSMLPQTVYTSLYMLTLQR